MWVTFIIVFGLLALGCAVLALRGARRDRALRGLEDPDAPRALEDGAHEIAVAEARASRPDGAMGFTGGPGA